MEFLHITVVFEKVENEFGSYFVTIMDDLIGRFLPSNFQKLSLPFTACAMNNHSPSLIHQT